jgi:hypothetical protein
MKKTLKIILAVILIPVLAFVAFLLYITLADYKPADMKPLKTIQRSSLQIEPDESLKFISWNIGYAGLGREMDFFYDGGQQVRASKILEDILFNSRSKTRKKHTMLHSQLVLIGNSGIFDDSQLERIE